MLLIFCLNLLDDSYGNASHTETIKQNISFSSVKLLFFRLWLVTSLKSTLVFGEKTHYPIIKLLHLI